MNLKEGMNDASAWTDTDQIDPCSSYLLTTALPERLKVRARARVCVCEGWHSPARKPVSAVKSKRELTGTIEKISWRFGAAMVFLPAPSACARLLPRILRTLDGRGTPLNPVDDTA